MRSMEHQELGGTYPSVFPYGMRKLNFCVRFAIGRPLDNKARTDASFWHAATKGYPSRWLRLPGYARAGVRLGLLYLLPLLLVLWVAWAGGAHGWVLRVVAWHLLALSLPAAAVAVPKIILSRGLVLPWPIKLEEERRFSLEARRVVTGRGEWERRKVLPVANVLAPLLQIERRRLRPGEARKWVTVPRSYLSPKGKPVVIELPPYFSGVDEKANARVVKAASHALGASALEPTWQLAGENRALLLSAPELPPSEVTFSMVREYMENAEEYRPVLGMVSPEKVMNAEMIEDSPHILIGGGPGSGKSALLKAFAAHFAHQGWGIVVLDWKRTKQFEWMRGMRGVTIVNDIEGIHDMGVRIGEEVESRMAQGMGGRAKLVIIRDEWNVTATMLYDYWDRYYGMLSPEEKRENPKKSPALRGFAILDFAGREYGMHDILAAQRGSNRIFNGNTDMRECFNIRMLARYSEQTKRMLVGNIKPFPRKSNTPGRWTVVSGEDVAVVQVPWLEPAEARAFAESGVECPTSPFARAHRVNPAVPQDDTQGKELPPGSTGSSESLPILEGDVVHSGIDLKLSDFAELYESMGITKRILQKAAGDPASGFPSAVGGDQFKGYTYDSTAVKEWVLRRQAAKQAEREARK